MRAYLTKWALLFALSVTALNSYSQNRITGVVLDAETGFPIPFAGLTLDNDNRGTIASAEGEFDLKWQGEAEVIRVRAFGYKNQSIPYTGQSEINIELEPNSTIIAEVEVEAGENPLHRIIQNVIDARDENNPLSLDAFSYETYSKFVFTLVQDSIGPDFDTIRVPIDTTRPELGDSIVRIDSSNYFNRQFAEKQHFFLMESVTERKYAQGRDNERVLATRISGLQTPLFVLLSNEMQSFSFYDNYIEILGSERVNPVAPGAIGRYVYVSEDTSIYGTDTTFVIQYFPEPDHRFKGMDGTLYISSDNWSVTRVIARPTGQDLLGIAMGEGEVFGVEIQQFYEKVEGHYFPSQLTMDLRRFSTDDETGGSAVIMSTGEADPVGLGTTQLKNIQINPPLERRDVERISVEIDPMAAERSEAFWYGYRGDSLTLRERRTYTFMDSIGEELNVDRNLKWLLALQTGKIRWGYFDFNVDKLLRYNVYEGIRLGMGVQTSPKLSEYFSIGGNFAYGTGDNVWKYGYFGEIHLNKPTETKLFGGYSFDIYETGGTRYNLQRKTILGDLDYRFLNIPTFDEVSDAYVGISHRIWPNWRARLSAHRINTFTSGGYQYRSEPDAFVGINGFNTAMLRLEMEYAPNDRFMSGVFGLRALDVTYPRFRVSYEESLDGMFDQNFPYRRLDAMVQHQVERVYSGVTTFTLTGSYINKNLPYPFLAGPDANGSLLAGGFFNSIINQVATVRGFETMLFNQYAANQFVALDVRHSFEDRLFSIGEWAPTIELVYRTTFGMLNNPEDHFGVNLRDSRYGYHEAGVEINNIWSGLGVGFYQRFGAYYQGEYEDNFALKLTYRFTGFGGF